VGEDADDADDDDDDDERIDLNVPYRPSPKRLRLQRHVTVIEE